MLCLCIFPLKLIMISENNVKRKTTLATSLQERNFLKLVGRYVEIEAI